MMTPESEEVEVTVRSLGREVIDADREWYRVEERSGGRSWKIPLESCWTKEVLPCLISPA